MKMVSNKNLGGIPGQLSLLIRGKGDESRATHIGTAGNPHVSSPESSQVASMYGRQAAPENWKRIRPYDGVNNDLSFPTG